MTEPTKTRTGDRPLPTPGRECVQDALIADIQARRNLGIQRYGRPLETHNGRDATRDALEEALDLAVYLKQVELEMRDLRQELADAQAALATAASAPAPVPAPRFPAGFSVAERIGGGVLLECGRDGCWWNVTYQNPVHLTELREQAADHFLDAHPAVQP